MTFQPQLDAYLSGIREEFDRLNKELDQAKNQRDEYQQNCMVEPGISRIC